MIPIIIICAYLCLLLGLGLMSNRFFRGTSQDYFVASRSIGSFMLLMSVFGTTMTAFALVGSTGKAFDLGIGVYGLMASWSGLIHSACFFLVGIKLWALGKRYGYFTQCQFFRARFDSPMLGYLLFPVVVALVIPYLLIGVMGAGSVMRGLTIGSFPETFPGVLNEATGRMMFVGAVPPWLTGMVICIVVLCYVFAGGVRSAAWANTFQTLVFMVTGLVAFLMIGHKLGGLSAASHAVLENSPQHLQRGGMIGYGQFLTYMFIPLSVGMFPHLFQHWLTARSAQTFKLVVIAHPICIMIVWVPCILIGIWAAGAGMTPPGGNSNALLGYMVGELVHSPVLTGLLIAGVMAAIMSSLDSQFMCLGTMFTNDVVLRIYGEDRISDKQRVLLARVFIVAIVVVTYLLSLVTTTHVFDLGVWCFSGFASLFPMVFAAVYWRRATKAGMIACLLTVTVLWVVLFWMDQATPGGGDEFLLWGLMPVTYIISGGIVALVVVSLLTKPPSDATIKKFFPKALEGMPS